MLTMTDAASTSMDAATMEPPRFEIGMRVKCNMGTWKEGTVVKHWYRDESWPADKIVPYQIQLDEGPLIFAPKDDDRIIMKCEPSYTPPTDEDVKEMGWDDVRNWDAAPELPPPEHTAEESKAVEAEA